jgi:hypothetical protein
MPRIVRKDQPLAKDGKLPELTVTWEGKLAVKVYLCRDCAAGLRAKQQEDGQLKKLDIRLLCGTCRANALRGMSMRP